MTAPRRQFLKLEVEAGRRLHTRLSEFVVVVAPQAVAPLPRHTLVLLNRHTPLRYERNTPSEPSGDGRRRGRPATTTTGSPYEPRDGDAAIRDVRLPIQPAPTPLPRAAWAGATWSGAVSRLPCSILVPSPLRAPRRASARLRDDASILPRAGLRLRGTDTCRVDAAGPAPSDAHGFGPGRRAVAVDVPRPRAYGDDASSRPPLPDLHVILDALRVRHHRPTIPSRS